MKNQLFIALFAMFIISCDNNDKNETNQPEIPITYFASQIDLRIQDSKGIDLLNRENAGCYRDSDIEILESVGENNNVSVMEYSHETDYYYLKLLLDYPKPDIAKGKQYDEEYITKVIFGNNEADEIKGLYELKYNEDNDKNCGIGSGYTVILQKAWFNGKEIYEIQTAQNSDWELPVIVKEANN